VTLPEPRPGLVIRYSFLWSHESLRGALEGSKDRPCAIVVAARRAVSGDIQVVVAPITHSPPADPSASMELSAQVCQSLDFDAGRHWLRFDELNSFIWPGYDLRPRTDRRGGYEYGMLPQPIFEQLRRSVIERQRLRRAKVVPRT
jgi:hypothetical protein